MSRPAATLSVTSAPIIGEDNLRIDLELPVGLTVAQIVELSVPGLTAEERKRLRVSLIKDGCVQGVPSDIWHLAKPHEGVQIAIQLVPAKNALRSILSIIVSIAAVAIGNIFGATLGSALGISTAQATSLIGVGVTTIGGLLVNALIPPYQGSSNEVENRFTISGWRNRLEPDAAVPQVAGTIRYAPPFAAFSYSEIVGDDQYIRALFCFGYGALELSDHRIGEEPIETYDEVEIEVRNGVQGDAPVSLFPRQVIEESVGRELTYPYQRDDLGEILDDLEPEITPVIRTTATSATGASVLLVFPSGLVRYNDEGKLRELTVTVRIEERRVGTDVWVMVDTLEITAAKAERFFRQHSWDFASRGQWQVRLTLLTVENTDTRAQMDVQWAALQSIRPEYPLNFGKPLALVGVRIKATAQLNGQLDNYNALAKVVCPDWDVGQQAWVMRATQNPASIFRYILQGPGNIKPAADDEIDLDMLQDWHAFCEDKGLRFNHVFDKRDETMGDSLIQVALAGRASPRHDGTKWTVTIDRPQSLIVDEMSTRNSSEFRIERTYVEYPDAYRVRFLDETNDFKQQDRYVPWPGHEGDIVLTEELELIGKTDPDEIYREARRRQLEVIHRPDLYSNRQEGAARAATRGDQVMVSHEIIQEAQTSARVTAVDGRLVRLDQDVTFVTGQTYGIRFRIFGDAGSDAPDTTGQSVVSRLVPTEAITDTLLIEEGDDVPSVNSIVLFGKSQLESIPLIITSVDVGEDFTGFNQMVDAAPIIDELVDALDIPKWSGVVGNEIEGDITQPSAPVFSSITFQFHTSFLGITVQTSVDYLIQPGPGTVPVSRLIVEHRLASEVEWQTVQIPSANGGGTLEVYERDDEVIMRAYAISENGVGGPYSAEVSFVVGEGSAAFPQELETETIDVSGDLGGVLISFATGGDEALASVQLYHAQVAVLDRDAHAVGDPVAVEPNATFSRSVGDTTRSNLLAQAVFSADGGWSASGQEATHTPGTQSVLTAPVVIQDGATYRAALTLSAATAGSVTARLGGPAPGAGQLFQGLQRHLTSFIGGGQNDSVEYEASVDFDGTLSEAVLYLETAACLDQGTHYFWLEPQNADGLPGPTSGPFVVVVV